MKSKHIIAITALAFASLTSCTSVLDKDDLTAVSERQHGIVRFCLQLFG